MLRINTFLKCVSISQDMLILYLFSSYFKTLSSHLLSSFLSFSLSLQVEDLIRQLRGHLKTVKTEGELKPFHSFTDIRERLRRPLKQPDITASDFLTVLRFMHKVRS